MPVLPSPITSTLYRNVQPQPTLAGSGQDAAFATGILSWITLNPIDIASSPIASSFSNSRVMWSYPPISVRIDKAKSQFHEADFGAMIQRDRK